MQLSLPPRFSFADFKRAAPIDQSTVWQVLMERNAERVPVKRQAVAQENLRKIVESTFRLANKAGFGAMTLRELSREAGLSMGGLYGYITSKDDLASMMEDMIRFVAAEIPAWFESHGNARERLDATLRAHVFQSELLHPWFYFVFMESRTLSAAQRLVAKGSEMRLHDELAALIEATGQVEGLQAELIAAHCQAMVQDWHIKRWKFKQLKTSVDQFADSISDFVRAGLTRRAR
ncbi:MAG TPA: helix-turn-helix domain-containing protein [Albitalea sp.]|nr:helix-turn-helix domain-containing protein [Albitalea sp.]